MAIVLDKPVGDSAATTAPERVAPPAPPVKLPRERAATSCTMHLLFGSGPFAYRLLRWAQRSRR